MSTRVSVMVNPKTQMMANNYDVLGSYQLRKVNGMEVGENYRFAYAIVC
jgi:hypothetical protein